ncbi:acyltransferase family protein [Hoeflea alexandrii]|uniref:Acyltransferase family protein n=1 Tax=Hoeflea alexandrii TaxID=288436 RepID=A0ABT1CXL1_9HYPH|nr:acyltransferase family protein [Hoeflea alexandrii]MCO6410939.1 acyltransferase family protein [Hoeflea alexandrii]MCY0150999.1 acyltransferase family protein [Hoeflea alexandrii]
MNNADRMKWVDIAKGVSIILVVMMYAVYNVGRHTGSVGFLHYVIAFATPFRMPEFFLISGLFLSAGIERPWRRYVDRRFVHYMYFYVLWAFIMIALKVGVFARDPVAMAADLASAIVQPYGVLWFVYMLGVFAIAAKLLWQFRVPHWLVIAVATGLQIVPINVSSYIVTQFSAYFLFFYIGYAFAPQIFRMAGWVAENQKKAIAALGIWFVVNGLLVFLPSFELLPAETRMGYAAFPPLHIMLGVAGAIALCAFSVVLMGRRYTGWLRWIGEHSLVIYLAFTIPMSIFREIMMSSGLIAQTGPLSLAVFLVALIAPIMLYLAINWTGYGRFLFVRAEWARIRPE